MLDVFNIPTSSKFDVQIFNANSVTGGVNWHTWRKPRGVNFVQFFALAGGAGGGGGVCGAVSTAAGGGGGGSGAYGNILFSAWAIPDIIYISVGYGGAGGTGSTTVSTIGSAGIATYISIDAAIGANNLLMTAGGGSAGTNASGATAGGAGGAGTGGSIAAANLAALGYFFSTPPNTKLPMASVVS